MTTVSAARPLCPYLPALEPELRPSSLAAVGDSRGGDFYLLALRCAQATWAAGYPAQAILMLNRAFSAELSDDDPLLAQYPPPYAAMAWMMDSASDEDFLGNPRRHFQHLATRMSGPRPLVRTWRAWACWWLAGLIRPHWPNDEKQIREEKITLPSEATIRQQLGEYGWAGEVDHWDAVRARFLSA